MECVTEKVVQMGRNRGQLQPRYNTRSVIEVMDGLKAQRTS